MSNKASKVSSILNIVDKVFAAIEASVLVVTGSIIIATLFYGAIVRYFLKGSFPEQVEITWYMHTWLVYVGSAAVLRFGDHPMVGLVRGKRGKVYNTLMYVVCIAFPSIILYTMYTLPRIIWRQRSIILGIEYTYFYIAMTVGLVLMIVRYVMKLIRMYIK